MTEPFKRLYSEDDSPKRKRDRFDIEFNETERQEFTDAKRLLLQDKDVTAAKQLLFLGAKIISSHDQFIAYLRECLFINQRLATEKRLDVLGVIEDQIRQLNNDMGRKLN